jgi:hypothetical protein
MKISPNQPERRLSLLDFLIDMQRRHEKIQKFLEKEGLSEQDLEDYLKSRKTKNNTESSGIAIENLGIGRKRKKGIIPPPLKAKLFNYMAKNYRRL